MGDKNTELSEVLNKDMDLSKGLQLKTRNTMFSSNTKLM